MLLNLLAFFLAFCFFVCSSIFLWIKWRKIGISLIVLIIIVLCVFYYGIIKYSIFGSMRLEYNPSIISLEVNPVFTNHGETVLDTFKSWSKILRGKKPIYISTGGTQILVDPIGDEKSIKLFKRF